MQNEAEGTEQAMTGEAVCLRLREDRIAWRQAGEEVVVLDRQTSEYLAINHAGIGLWQALARGATPAELADELRERWGLSSEDAAQDVDRFVGVLAARGLLCG